MWGSRFEAYVDLARNGKNAIWRIVLGIVLIAIADAAASFLSFVAGMATLVLRNGYSPAELQDFDYEAFLNDRIGLVILLSASASLWIGVWLAMKILHRRPVRDLFGIERRLYWSDFIRAAAVPFVVGLITTPIALFIDPTFVRTDASLLEWMAWVPPVLVLCFLQTSAEELVFRGYLHQVLAARFFAKPLIWLAGPTLLFTLVHWQSGALTGMNVANLLAVLAMSLSMTALLIANGNLAAAMGMHFGNNVGAFLLFSNDPKLGSAALFIGRSISDPDWTTWQAVLSGLYGVLAAAASLWLLLHPKSPFRLRSLAPREAGFDQEP